MTISIENMREVLILASNNTNNLKQLNQLERRTLLVMLEAIQGGAEAIEIQDVSFEDMRAKLEGLQVKEPKSYSFKALKNIFADRIGTDDLRREISKAKKAELERVTSQIAQNIIHLVKDQRSLDNLSAHSAEQLLLKDVESIIGIIGQQLSQVPDSKTAIELLQGNRHNLLNYMQEILTAQMNTVGEEYKDKKLPPEWQRLEEAKTNFNWNLKDWDFEAWENMKEALAPFPELHARLTTLEKLRIGLGIIEFEIEAQPSLVAGHIKTFKDAMHRHMSQVLSRSELDPTHFFKIEQLGDQIVREQGELKKLEALRARLLGGTTVKNQLQLLKKESDELKMRIIFKSIVLEAPDAEAGWLEERLAGITLMIEEYRTENHPLLPLLEKFKTDLQNFLQLEPSQYKEKAEKMMSNYAPLEMDTMSLRLFSINSQMEDLDKEQKVLTDHIRFLLSTNNIGALAAAKQRLNEVQEHIHALHQKTVKSNLYDSESDFYQLRILENEIVPDLQTLIKAAEEAGQSAKAQKKWLKTLHEHKQLWLTREIETPTQSKKIEISSGRMNVIARLAANADESAIKALTPRERKTLQMIMKALQKEQGSITIRQETVRSIEAKLGKKFSHPPSSKLESFRKGLGNLVGLRISSSELLKEVGKTKAGKEELMKKITQNMENLDMQYQILSKDVLHQYYKNHADFYAHLPVFRLSALDNIIDRREAIEKEIAHLKSSNDPLKREKLHILEKELLPDLITFEKAVRKDPNQPGIWHKALIDRKLIWMERGRLDRQLAMKQIKKQMLQLTEKEKKLK